MKLFFLTTTILVVVVGAAGPSNQPHLSFRIQDGSYKGLGDGLDPTVTWQSSFKNSGNMDFAYGMEASATPTLDLASLARKLWGKATHRNVLSSGWGLSARADVDLQQQQQQQPQQPRGGIVDLELQAKHAKSDLSLYMDATASASHDWLGKIRRIEATKGWVVHNAKTKSKNRVTVTPRYNLETSQAKVLVTYDTGDTGVNLVMSPQQQTVTVSRQVDKDNRVAPTISSNGDIILEWKRQLDSSSGSSVTTTIRPNDCIDMEWNDGGWTACMNMPLDGTTISGANVSLKKDVAF